MSAEAIAKAREIAAKLSGAITGGSELGKRKNRWEEEGGGPGLGSMKKKKIYVPVRDYPDINFLGLLIGPKGSTQKQLQDASGAKILIRGKGASKDGGPSNTGHPDDNDELHVSIEGTEDAVEKASQEVEKILFNPEQALRLKQEQLKHLAEMNSSAMGGKNADNTSDIYGPGNSDAYQVELRVPNNMVGLVIGKGGENVLRIQAQLAVNCQIAKESDMKPGETLRSIIIKGSPAGVTEAKKRIDDIIAAQVSKSNPASNNAQASQQLDSAFIVKLPVPNDKVGIIIGKGGMTIKGIQERSRATVQIPAGPDEDDPSIRTLTLGAETKEAVDAAQMEIFMTLQNSQKTQQDPYGINPNATYVVVPDEKVGSIIGKGGSTVKDLQSRHRVRVQIPQSADIGSNPPMRTLCITGPIEAQPAVKYEIEMIVAGTPIHAYGGGAVGNNAIYGGYSAGAAYGAGYGAQASYGYYGDPYGAGAAASTAGYSYGASGASAGSYYGAAASGASTAGAATEEVPTDPTAYYNDFWQYAVYYGEAAARLYYGAWSPPEGTPPPAGIVLPAASAESAAAVATTTATSATVDASSTVGGDTEAKGGSDAEAAASWEAYKKQYAEWYETYGKSIGADPNPPAM